MLIKLACYPSLFNLIALISFMVTTQSYAAPAPVKATQPYLLILGVAQDAGYPQAGCFKAHCMTGWQNKDKRRSATSLGLIMPASKTSYMFEATPHFAEQFYALHLVAPMDSYTFSGIFLTHAHIGHYAGLMHLGREAMGASGVPVFAMPKMADYLSNNGPWSQLVKLNNIELQLLQHNREVQLSTVKVKPFLVPHRDEYAETVGYSISGPEKNAIFIPDIDKWQHWDQPLQQVVTQNDYVLIDATFFADGELPGRDMSTIPHPLVTDTMALLGQLPATEKAKVWFIHINHTNPILDVESQAYQKVIDNGFNIAFEGLKLAL